MVSNEEGLYRVFLSRSERSRIPLHFICVSLLFNMCSNDADASTDCWWNSDCERLVVAVVVAIAAELFNLCWMVAEGADAFDIWDNRLIFCAFKLRRTSEDVAGIGRDIGLTGGVVAA